MHAWQGQSSMYIIQQQQAEQDDNIPLTPPFSMDALKEKAIKQMYVKVRT